MAAVMVDQALGPPAGSARDKTDLVRGDGMINLCTRRGTLALLALAASAACSLAQNGTLNDEVARTIATHRFGGAHVGVSIIDMDGGAILANIHGNDPFTPASNMKLLTSGAALMVLGPDFAFKTEIIRDGDRLIVKGDGDPALADPEVLKESQPKLTVNDVLSALAGAVTKAGMTDVKEIIIDDRVFDREYVHPTWPPQNLDRPYSAEICGLNFHANVMAFFPGPSPQGPGSPPTFSMEPDANWLHVDVRARTVADGKNSVSVSREDENHFVLRGDVRFQTQAPVEVTLHDPAAFFGRLFAQQLASSGVHIAKASAGDDEPAVRLADPTEKFQGKTIAVVRTPIADVLHRCNTDSENLYAESLLKRMGNAVTKEPGSWNNGAAVLRMTITQHLGAEAAAATTILDGSGLSRGNLVTPATFTRWLGELANNPQTRDVYTNSLAYPGVGTLRSRFRNAKLVNQVRGKSGFIDGVRCLSGYVINSGGHRVCYSVMVNDITNDDETRDALELHEEVVKIADRWLAGHAMADAGAKGGG
jgi:D-alanyl-D-alanine carboxypeptidase/D-alanyl-D-alanine-endopeptidase (penicillin-binding protein 4)